MIRIILSFALCAFAINCSAQTDTIPHVNEPLVRMAPAYSFDDLSKTFQATGAINTSPVTGGNVGTFQPARLQSVYNGASANTTVVFFITDDQ